MSQNILVINSGSSSVKFSLFNMQQQIETASGLAERLGSDDAALTVKWPGDQTCQTLTDSAYGTVLKRIIAVLTEQQLLDSLPLVIGHRVVHGGEFFSDPVVITDGVLDRIRQCSPLAPLHNPANLAGIEALAALYPDIPQVAVFDTAFHQSLPAKAFLYAVPYKLYEEQKVRRYGFHGVSHQYVAAEAAARLGISEQHGIISAHLGNGCSACAVANGQSMDTTMGMTPLEGLVMGTRSGDVDPGLHQFLHQQKGWDVETVTDMLNKESGMLGLSGLSNDMRTLEAAASEGAARAQLALEVFCFRLARHIGGLATSLSRLDALVFTGGIGENSRFIRAQVVANLAIFGFALDPVLNAQDGDALGRISAPAGPQVIVVKTKEELMIAQAALALI
ncbi:acetate kinase [Reinekea sp.]|jgi:acetate kinase|uniref:acetate/propionate family kinase n=1 Tax=Reinekea sp. TaxID=1970455 RepID=UPI002A7FC60C|nr:acetate kinase [Reinekea sp.]